MAKEILIAVAALVGLVVVAALALTIFLDANQFRPALAARMSDALGQSSSGSMGAISIPAGGTSMVRRGATSI